ncbi:MAG TPA: DUF5666 domain-containing protein [Chloroflexota bacterium]|nr:DUF5666 domain-containing protein [Chloroflexota bacterium]
MRAFAAVATLTLLLAACGGGAAPPASSAAARPASAAAPAPASAAASASAKPAASAAAKPAASGSAAAQPNPSFTDGTVQAIDQTKLTLTEGGKTFTITPQTSFAQLQKENPTDVKPGQFVAITAKQQPDNTLLASFLRVQDSSGGRPASQFPMDYTAGGQPQPGNMMINAPIKSADTSGMVVTLSGGDATVKYAPGIQIMHQVEGKASDVAPGKKVLIVSRGDAAASIAVYA